MIRLAQAHARMMFRDEITTFDAISVVLLLEVTINSGLIKENFPHTRYTSDRDYFELKVEVLQRLKLVKKKHEDLLWRNMKKDIAKHSRTPSPVTKFIEDAELNNLMESEILTDTFSNMNGFGGPPVLCNLSMLNNPFSFKISQEIPFRTRPPLLEIKEEEKHLETSQKMP
jgi:hypothetical protein